MSNYQYGNVDIWASESQIQNINKLWLDISGLIPVLKKYDNLTSQWISIQEDNDFNFLDKNNNLSDLLNKQISLNNITNSDVSKYGNILFVDENGDSILKEITTENIQESENKRYQTDLQKLYNDATSSIQDQLDNNADQILIIKSGFIGFISPNDLPPTPNNSGYYEFNESGICEWITDGSIFVSSGDRVSAEFNNNIYVYKHESSNSKVDKSSIEQERSLSDDKIPSSKLLNNEINIIDYNLKNNVSLTVGKNKFNKSNIITGYYVNSSNGNLEENSIYFSSDFIRINKDTNYFTRQTNHWAYYDVNKNFISGGDYINVGKSPINASYIRISTTLVFLDITQIELGTSFTNYEDYTEYIDPDLILNNSISNEKIESVNVDKLIGNIKNNQVDFIQVGLNKFDKNAAILGYYVNWNDGTLDLNSNYAASDFIPIKPNTNYILSNSNSVYCAFYDASKEFISGNHTQQFPILSPSTAYYIRITVTISKLNEAQLEEGVTPTIYQNYRPQLSGIEVPTNDYILFLPSEVCVAVGRTIELYNSQVFFCGNISNYHFAWDCQIGKAMKRKFSITGTTPKIGEYSLVLSVYDNNMNIVASASTILKIISATISSTKNILTIGDSITNNKPWLEELRTLSDNKYTLVGTRGTSSLKHEGRSGFSAIDYLNATSYAYENEGVHPFWNADNDRFDWNYYKSNTLINPDAIQIFLGTNGIALDPTENAISIKQIVDYIRDDDETIPIFIVFTLYRGNQDGIGIQTSVDGYSSNRGAWKLQEDFKVFSLMTRLYSLLYDYSNLHFIPVSLCHDSEYNFGSVQTPVNPRATQTELIPVEATHPQTQGYLQIADIMFSSICKNLQ